jgi:flavin reductase (DIM6/NTAB) family NADH-FMN oxidoreductase RutF
MRRKTVPHREALAGALGLVPSGLFILTAGSGDDETGMLASWVQQCSFDPPQITVALKRDRFVHALLSNGAAFGLNILAAGQTDLLKHFGKGFDRGQPAFTGLVVKHAEGVPILPASLAHLTCEVAGRCKAGDHDLVIGRVTGGGLHGEGQPYVHVRKNGLKY